MGERSDSGGQGAGLTLLTGPAGSGKTGEVLERFASRLDREPVLVVPTTADVERFEDELLARRPVALGGRIVTFDRLFGLLAEAAGLLPAPPLTDAQRRALLGAVVDGAGLVALAESARRPGFVDSLARLIDELQAALIGPAELARRLAGTTDGSARRRQLAELGELFAAYVRRRDALPRHDRGSAAAAVVSALRAQPGLFGGRPVLVHGFDDLARAQLAAICALAADGEVLVSVVHEPGRACLAARERLVEQVSLLAEAHDTAGEGQLRLETEGDASMRAGPTLRREDLPPGGGTGLLAHLERAFLTDDPERRTPDGGLHLLEGVGARGELEQVGAAIARLLRAGVEPGQIGVIVREPEEIAGLAEEVLEGFGVPLAIEADSMIGETAVGRALLALLRGSLTTRSAADLVAFLRCPGRAPAGLVDRLERAIRMEQLESIDEALERWEGLGGRRPWELDALRTAAARGSATLLELARTVARELAERPLRRRAPLLAPGERADQLAAEAVASALEEVAELAAVDGAVAPTPELLVEALERLRFRRRDASVGGRVELISPYRARARQFAHVFVLSLEEGRFPRPRRDDPFLTAGERRRAGLPEEADQREEERYLFYVCLTRATRTLSLSYRAADDDGGAVTRSFLVDELLDLLSPGAEAGITRTRGASATVFDPPSAPTERELARSLAERRLVAPPSALGASEALARRLETALLRARERADRLPGRLTVAAVRDQFAARKRIGASSLEENAECSFRYFVQHELDPGELAPKAEPLVRGALTHSVLEGVYAERGERPGPETVESMIVRAHELLGEAVRGTSLDPARPRARAVNRRIESDIARYLRYDAEHGGGALVAVEAGFGDRQGDERPPLLLEGFELHGKIDRIDRVGDGQALIRDYKTGARVASRKEIAEELKLQLPLYMLAVRELWGLEPVGGVYHPLGSQHDAKPRGLLRGPPGALPLEEHFVRTDYTADPDEFERALVTARAEAERIAARIRDGHLARDPLGGSCPAHCDFHPICRRERGEKNPEEEERRLDDDEG